MKKFAVLFFGVALLTSGSGCCWWGLPSSGYGGYGGYGGGSPPVVYIQKEGGAQAATGSQANYWHYCRKPEGYYPHVKKCPDGWMKVVPQLSPTQ